VLLSEYTGASSLLHVELPGGEIFLVAYDGQTIDADTALGLTIAPDRLHFFDAAGRRVN
jgi:multiple sugar transport system ATP-binding protein